MRRAKGTRHFLVTLVAIVVGAASRHLVAQQSCPRADLPAYAHNDYNNPKPLFDALRLGYQGAEADVFLIDSELRVGHDRRQARRGGTLEKMYLQPLKELAQRCEYLVLPREPFLLNVELKEASRSAFDSLLALVNRYREIFSYKEGEATRQPFAAVTLVGWQPPTALIPDSQLGSVRFHHKLTRVDESLPQREAYRMIGMASVDYGKTMGGWRTSARRREQWFTRLRQLGESITVRVYNVPRDSTVYRRLLASGVELIGTETLEATRRLLLPLVRLAPCYAISAGPWIIPDTANATIDEIPAIVMHDTAHVGFIFQNSDWRHLTAFMRSGKRDDWMWYSRIGFFSITNSNGFGAVGLDFRIAGDSLYGRAEMSTDMVGPRYPYAPARGHVVACP